MPSEEAEVAKAEVDAAKVMVERHKVLSPIAGVVVDIRTHKGEAVQPTQPVIRVVSSTRLWVEGHVHRRQVRTGRTGRRESRSTS